MSGCIIYAGLQTGTQNLHNYTFIPKTGALDCLQSPFLSDFSVEITLTQKAYAGQQIRTRTREGLGRDEMVAREKRNAVSP